MIAKLVHARRALPQGTPAYLLLGALAIMGLCAMLGLLFLPEAMKSLGSSALIGLDAVTPRQEDPAIRTAAAAPDSAVTEQELPLAKPELPFDHAMVPAATVEAAAEEPANKVALTFDDGPDTKYTPMVLDILDAYKIKATFFVVGTQVEKHPEVLKRIKEQGHTIGNHSYAHSNLSKLDKAELRYQINAADEIIQSVLGESTPYFRAPYGALSRLLTEELEAAGKQLIGWNVDTRDWAGTSAAEILTIVEETIKPDAVILMHSFGGKGGKLDNMIEALPFVIEFLQSQGYEFDTLAERNIIQEEIQ